MSSPFLSSAAARTISTSSGRAFLPKLKRGVVFEGGQRLRCGRQVAGALVRERCIEGGGHGGAEVVESQRQQLGAPSEVTARFEAVGKIENLIQWAHRCSGQRVLANGRQYGLVLDPKPLAGQFGAESRVQHHRVGTLERVDRHPPFRAFAQQPLAGIEPRQIVEQPGDARLACIDAVRSGQPVGGARYAQDVRVAMYLIDVFAHPPRGTHEIDARGDQ